MTCNNEECFNMIALIKEYTINMFGKTIDNKEAWSILDRTSDSLALNNFVEDAIRAHAKLEGWLSD